MPKILSEEQVEQYHRDGYISPVRIMSEDEAISIRYKLEAFEAGQGGSLQGIQRTKVCMRLPFIYDIVSNSNVLDAIEDLIGPDILLYQNGAWIKEPELGTYVSWHQDITYFGMAPPDLVSGWVALSPASMESGCIQVLPGSQELGMLPVDYSEVKPTNMLASGQRVIYEVDETEAVPMPLKPGEMSLHHVCLIHSSLPNHSAERRIGFSVACMAPHIRQTTEAKATAMLMRGEDRYGHYILDEMPATAVGDPATIERHERAVALYRAKAEECGNDNAWRLG
jgi:non-haem Fe2+, alpha-ketoglutarate-dependent halogenase